MVASIPIPFTGRRRQELYIKVLPVSLVPQNVWVLSIHMAAAAAFQTTVPDLASGKLRIPNSRGQPAIVSIAFCGKEDIASSTWEEGIITLGKTKINLPNSTETLDIEVFDAAKVTALDHLFATSVEMQIPLNRSGLSGLDTDDLIQHLMIHNIIPDAQTGNRKVIKSVHNIRHTFWTAPDSMQMPSGTPRYHALRMTVTLHPGTEDIISKRGELLKPLDPLILGQDERTGEPLLILIEDTLPRGMRGHQKPTKQTYADAAAKNPHPRAEAGWTGVLPSKKPHQKKATTAAPRPPAPPKNANPSSVPEGEEQTPEIMEEATLTAARDEPPALLNATSQMDSSYSNIPPDNTPAIMAKGYSIRSVAKKAHLMTPPARTTTTPVVEDSEREVIPSSTLLATTTPQTAGQSRARGETPSSIDPPEGSKRLCYDAALINDTPPTALASDEQQSTPPDES